MTDSTHQKDAVVLSSGGANGAYAVGVLKALFNGKSPATDYEFLDPEALTGDSIGAFNAAFLVSVLKEMDTVSAVADLERVWLEEIAEDLTRGKSGAFKFRGDLFRHFDPRYVLANPVQSFVELAQDGAFLIREGLLNGIQLATSDQPLAHGILNLVNLSMFVSFDSFLDIIKKVIRFDNIRRSNRALRIVTTHVEERTLKVFSNQDLTDHLGPQIIQASTALPGFFPPVEIDGQTYVDAAVLDYARVSPALATGAYCLHVVYLDPQRVDSSTERAWSTLDAFHDTFLTIWHDRVNQTREMAHKFVRYRNALNEAVQKGSLSRAEAERLLHVVDFTLPMDTRLAIHRYFPTQYHGPLGILKIGRERLEGLIEQGYNDAVNHDCEANGCFLPEGTGLKS